MLEKFNQLAEHAANNVSRRQFLDRVGRGAMLVAAAAGGLLASQHEVFAIGRSGRGPRCKQGEMPCWIIDEEGKRIRGCCPRQIK